MNFFEYQDKSRRNTKFFIAVFAVALCLINVAIYFVVLLTAKQIGPFHSAAYLEEMASTQTSIWWWNSEIFMYSLLGTCTIVFGGSYYMIRQLAKGGSAVAVMLGGRRLDPNTKDLNEKKLQNVVEEMAIASGVTTPEIYLLDNEDSINAFAAGYTIDDAAIGVTKGTITLLNRDELQGVIAHEFSHILNGDMRLNIRLTGIVHGIMTIATIGYWIMRSAGRSGRSRSNRGGGGVYLILVGLALLVIGYIGVFFGKIIRSAVSRSREYLADASAVQFTRNADGVSGALKKIAGLDSHARIHHHNAQTMSHMFFGNALNKALFGFLATHPPIVDRIKRIDPNFKSPKKVHVPTVTDSVAQEAAMGFAAGNNTINLNPKELSESVGQVSAKHVNYAHGFLATLPDSIRDGAHDLFSAQAIVFAMLLDEQEEVRKRQLDMLGKQADPFVCRETHRLYQQVQELGKQIRLPLIDLSLPALRCLSKDQYVVFKKLIRALIDADHKVTLFEFIFQKIVSKHLDAHFYEVDKLPIRYRILDPVYHDVKLILTTLALAGHQDLPEAKRAFHLGIKRLGSKNLEMLERGQVSLKKLSQSLDRLAHASHSLKREILEAATAVVAADGVATYKELEVLRALGDSIYCPIPPLVL